jgi:hypothetical protein
VIIAEHGVTDTELRALMARARAAGNSRLGCDALVAIEGVAADGRAEARKRCAAAIAEGK